MVRSLDACIYAVKYDSRAGTLKRTPRRWNRGLAVSFGQSRERSMSTAERARIRTRRALCFIFALPLLLAGTLAGADEWTPTRSFRTFRKSDWRGLPQSSVMALAQSSD